MDNYEYGASPNVDAIMQDIVRYDLFKHVVELEAYGVTVVPPEKMQSNAGFIDRLKNAILRSYEKRSGRTIGDPDEIESIPLNWNCSDLLEEDDAFIEAGINPVMLTLVRWLCGQSATLGGQTWILKAAKSGNNITWHYDTWGLPPGAGHIAHMCNATWLCSDYEIDDGPTVFVPGSHRVGRGVILSHIGRQAGATETRHPSSPYENSIDGTLYKTFPIVAKAGSLAIWHGMVWHGSLPRKNKGLRVTLAQNFCRSYMRPTTDYDGRLSPQLLQKYPELERVIGKPLYPYKFGEGADRARIEPAARAGMDAYA